MEYSFQNSKAVRLKSSHDKFLTAEEDKTSVTQGSNGFSKPAKWTVELVESSEPMIRLKSCYGMYLTASNQPSTATKTGMKVIQTPTNNTLEEDSTSVKWLPIRKNGSSSVKLKSSRYGTFLMATTGNVTHAIPHWKAKRQVLWRVEPVDTEHKVRKKEKGWIKAALAQVGIKLDSWVLIKEFDQPRFDLEKSKTPVPMKEEKEEVHKAVVENEMPSELQVTTSGTDTLGSTHQSNYGEISESITDQTVTSFGGGEISSHGQADSVKITSDIKEYVMRDCILYCSMFPADYEFTRDTLVWSWIAAGIVNSPQKDEIEKVANSFFDRLIMLKLISPSGYDRLSDQMRYKLGKYDHVSLTNGKYGNTLDSEANSTDLEHLSLIFQEIDELQLKHLQNCRNLKTLLLHKCYGSQIHKCYGSQIENILNHVFLELKLITLIDLSCTNTVELPSSIENLRALMYLDVSKTPIMVLPESIGSLCNLETLILLGCQNLSGLPRGICELINLHHLELDIARQLQSTPTGIGNLMNLQTLRTFVVGRKDGNGITELRSMNKLKGSLCILKLENILYKEEAVKARLCDKKYLTKIEFLWSDLEDDKVTTEEEILENLQPHHGLHEVKIVFYSGGILPSWISNPSFNQMVNITLSGCRFCEKLPSFGELPSLKVLSVVDMDAVVYIDDFFCRKHPNQDHKHAFPQLEKLSFDGMSVLEKWTGVEKGDFPCLVQLVIKHCPYLVSLPSLSNLESLEVLEIRNCPELSYLPEKSSVKCLIVKHCPKLLGQGEL